MMFLDTQELYKILIYSGIIGFLIGGMIVHRFMMKKQQILMSKMTEIIVDSKNIVIHYDKLSALYKSRETDNSISINFTGDITVENLCAINGVTFKLPDGKTILINRDVTEFSTKDNKFTMIWRNCHICYDNRKEYLSWGEHEKILDEMIFGDFNLIDDVPEYYAVTVDNWDVY